ncbi:hypothetical protein [Thiohalobacter sp.]|uniref:hypothetical protein n=1 Tax=Thiohalobacter sp. TaxID=2025948 RepID=UPI00260FDC21|nr:hypothetical protein [Thiohalobacter sp.]
MQTENAPALQAQATPARDQAAASLRPAANNRTEPANTTGSGVVSDTVSVSASGQTLALGAAGSIVRQRSTSVTIETRQGDRIRLDIQALARLDTAAVTATDGTQGLARAAVASRSGLSLQFSVEGTLDRRELKSLARVLHYVEEAAEEFYEGDAAEALKKLGGMKVDPNVLAGVSVDFQRSAAVRYAEIQRLADEPASALPTDSRPPAASQTGTAAVSRPAPTGSDRPASAMPAPETSSGVSGPGRLFPDPAGGSQRTPIVPSQASPVARLATAVRSSLDLGTESGLFQSPETGVKDLFRAVFDLVAGLRGDDEGEDEKGLPALLDSLLEILTSAGGAEARDAEDHGMAAAPESEEGDAVTVDSEHDADDVVASPATAATSDTRPDRDAVSFTPSAA